jgi:hypothetical protein
MNRNLSALELPDSRRLTSGRQKGDSLRDVLEKVLGDKATLVATEEALLITAPH